MKTTIISIGLLLYTLQTVNAQVHSVAAPHPTPKAGEAVSRSEVSTDLNQVLNHNASSRSEFATHEELQTLIEAMRSNQATVQHQQEATTRMQHQVRDIRNHGHIEPSKP